MTAAALERICAYKLEEVAADKRERPLAEIERDAHGAPAPRGFRAALESASSAGYGLIAEIKKASPSKGTIRADFDPPALAAAYAQGGAACLSVLTDTPSFGGAKEHLGLAREACTLPVLRKDFMLDPYQIAESRALGADCVLLIMAAISDAQARELAACAAQWDMDTLVEVHDQAELNRAAELEPRLVGINNRDLRTFETSLETSIELAPGIPAGAIAVGESGLSKPDDLATLARRGIRCFLVGESLMRQADVAAAARRLLANPVPPAPSTPKEAGACQS